MKSLVQNDNNNSSNPNVETKSIVTSHQEDKPSFDIEKSISEEQIEHAPEGTATMGKALFMLLKAFIGTGVVFLPKGFANGGLIFSIFLMLLIAFICLIAFQLLIEAQQKVGGDYGHVAYELYGSWLKYLILFFLCLSQMGFVSSYLLFISENLGLVIDQLSQCHNPLQSSLLIWIVLIIIIPITWVRKIAKLSWNAIIADVFILFGLVSVLYFTSSQIHQQNGFGPEIAYIDTTNFPLFIGTSVFSFEGIGMVIPIIQGMKEPEKFPRVLTMGMIICTVVFILIGSIGYSAYGEATKASVVSNLPINNGLSISVQLLYAIAMILTCPFMLYPAIVIIEQAIFGHRHSGRSNLKIKWFKNLTRSLIPIVCAGVSYGVGADGLDKFVSLVGSLACVPLCFIFPGILHFKITDMKSKKIVDVIMVIWGIGILFYTLVINIRSWMVPAAVSASSNGVCTI
ncbi:unnamed protein product [Cunninghamella blakesleeana]